MKPLGKCLRAAHIEQRDWKKALYNYLFTYRNTAHCTTNLIPSAVMFNRIPRFSISHFNSTTPLNITQISHENQHTEKLKQKIYYDTKMNAKNTPINIGDTVLIRQQQKNKLTPTFEHKPYVVTSTKGTMISAQSPKDNQTKTRNSSHLIKIPEHAKFHNETLEEDAFCHPDNIHLPRETTTAKNNPLPNQPNTPQPNTPQPQICKQYPRRERVPIEFWRKY